MPLTAAEFALITPGCSLAGLIALGGWRGGVLAGAAAGRRGALLLLCYVRMRQGRREQGVHRPAPRHADAAGGRAAGGLSG